MTLTVTVIIMALAALLFAYGLWQEKRERPLGKPPLVAPALVQLLALIVFFIMAAHLVTLITGRPFGPRGQP